MSSILFSLLLFSFARMIEPYGKAVHCFAYLCMSGVICIRIFELNYYSINRLEVKLLGEKILIAINIFSFDRLRIKLKIIIIL